MGRLSVRHLFLFFFALLSLISAFSLDGLARPAVVSSKGWSSYTTSHFRVLVESQRVDGARLATGLELFRELLSLRGYPVEQEGSASTTVVVFRRGRELRAYGAPDFPRGMRCVVFALAREAGSYLVMDSGAPGDELRESAYRGYMRLVIDSTPKLRPLWFRVGMSEYYRSFNRQQGIVSFGKQMRRYVFFLRTHRGLPIERLLTINDADLAEMRVFERDLFTAQSWGLVHFLFTNGDERKRQARLLVAALAEGSDAHHALVRAFGEKAGEISRQLELYIRRSRLPFQQLRSPAFSQPPKLTRQRVAPADVFFELGRLLALVQVPGASEHYRAALKLEADHPRALEELERLGAGAKGETPPQVIALARSVPFAEDTGFPEIAGGDPSFPSR